MERKEAIKAIWEHAHTLAPLHPVPAVSMGPVEEIQPQEQCHYALLKAQRLQLPPEQHRDCSFLLRFAYEKGKGQRPRQSVKGGRGRSRCLREMTSHPGKSSDLIIR